MSYAIRNVATGKIPRLSKVASRPPGTLSIGSGGEETGTISPEQIPARQSTDAEMAEMVNDIIEMLNDRELAFPEAPLVDIFRSIIAGERKAAQIEKYGDYPTELGRKVILRVIQDYAQQSGNDRLLQLLQRYEGFQSNKPFPGTRKEEKVPKPILSDKQRDYGSLLDVIDRLGRPAGSADLGRYRRRWLEYRPRNPTSLHKNRLDDVLDNMVREGVLKATRTAKGATVYEPGENADAYRLSPTI